MDDLDTMLNFQEARFRAFLRAVWSALSGRPNWLLSWQDVQDHLNIGGQVYRGSRRCRWRRSWGAWTGTGILTEQGILNHFSGRTEADLYLWIMDHQNFLRQQFGPQVQLEETARHFSRILHRLARVLRRLLSHRKKFLPEETNGRQSNPS